MDKSTGPQKGIPGGTDLHKGTAAHPAAARGRNPRYAARVPFPDLTRSSLPVIAPCKQRWVFSWVAWCTFLPLASQKLWQTQGISTSPSDTTFRIQAFEVTDQLHPEVHARCRPPVRRTSHTRPRRTEQTRARPKPGSPVRKTYAPRSAAVSVSRPRANPADVFSGPVPYRALLFPCSARYGRVRSFFTL